jgi:hypothetical protein
VQQLRYVLDRTDAAIAELEQKRAHIDATLAELRVINAAVRERAGDEMSLPLFPSAWMSDEHRMLQDSVRASSPTLGAARGRLARGRHHAARLLERGRRAGPAVPVHARGLRRRWR